MGQLSLDIEKKAQYWATSKAFDEKTKKEVQNLLETKNTKELTDRFYKELEFGTGGMRGIMGAGSSRMNIYNIQKATTALALHLKASFPGKSSLKVAISYDCRIDSDVFAKKSASVLAAHGIKSFITKQMRPTPVLSFMVRHLGCQAGICVTASHNPPVYNGYKVYWETGGQLVPPHDEAIVSLYGSLTDYESLKDMGYGEALKKGLIEEVLEEVDEAYFKKIKELSLNPHDGSSFKVAYSSIHGTGIYMVPKALELFGFKDVYVVEEQKTPDGMFPTVKSPNPEDQEALKMCLALGEAKGADVVLATDPDADRVAIVVKHQGQFVFLNGNELGCLLNDYVLASLHKKNKLPKNPLVIKTIVTTDLQKDIADDYGVHCDETLTGFKWICDKIDQYEKGVLEPKRQFICGGEESYGFLAGDFVRDKDAIIGCALACEMVAYYKKQGKSLVDVLGDLHTKHGVYTELLKTYTFLGKEGADQMASIMDVLRKAPPLEIHGKKLKQLIDVEEGKVFEFDEKTKELTYMGKTHVPASNVLQFVFIDDSKLSIRPSGTEPKIKVYLSVKDHEKGLQGVKLKEKQSIVAKHAEELLGVFARDVLKLA